jgi:chromosomal replication initiation ATPase DnaA
MLQSFGRPHHFARSHYRSHSSQLEQRCQRAPTSREAIELAVVQVFGVGRDDLRRLSRGRAKVALARQVAMYLAHVACGLTLTDTGKLFERDRTTVAHACGVIEDRRDDPLFDRALDLLEWAVPALSARPSTDRHFSL